MIETWKNIEHRINISNNHRGENNPNFGKPLSESQKQYLSELASLRTGNKNGNWKGGNTLFKQLIRGLKLYKEWRTLVFNREKYTDKFSGICGGDIILEAHHIISISTIIKMYDIKTFDDVFKCQFLLDPNNGILLEKSAHSKFHDLYGDDKNIYELTQEQILELYT